jgi:hypothetical protein
MASDFIGIEMQDPANPPKRSSAALGLTTLTYWLERPFRISRCKKPAKTK